MALASFRSPEGITTDGTSLYVADTFNSTIRKIVITTGAVSTLAGTPGMVGSADGSGAAASLNRPSGITTDGTNLYVADTENRMIRKIVIDSGTVTTTAGTNWYADGIGTAASFRYPEGVTTDGANLYITDSSNHTIRKIVIATGVVTTLAGTPATPGFTDGSGPAAGFRYPFGITTDGTNLYVADSWNHAIRKVVIATGEVTTLAGTPGTPGSADGTGDAAGFNSPGGITTDGTCIYVADSNNYLVRKIVIASGAVTTLAVTTLAGTPRIWGFADDTGPAAKFEMPIGITTNGTNLYVVETYNMTIRMIH